MPIRIAFDARPLLGPRTGVGAWLDLLLHSLAASTDWRFVLALPRLGGDLHLAGLADRVEVVAPRLALPGTVWLHTLAAQSLAGRADALVGTLGILPRRLGMPAVLMVHDLTPRTRPHQHTVANRFCFNAYFAESLAGAARIVTNSEATRRRLQEAFPRLGAGAVAIPLAVDPFFTQAPEGEGGESTRAAFAGGRHFILQLGTLEPRKGVTTLIAAHALLLRREVGAPDLVLAGARGWGGGFVERALDLHPAPERVHRPGYVTRDDARALLRHAEVVVLASEEEGFGLPLAEALACGARCVISDDEALVEVAGDAATIVPRGKADAVAAAIAAVLAGAAGSGRDRALARAASFAPARHADAWRLLLEDVLALQPS